jgi:hypothetical protein
MTAIQAFPDTAAEVGVDVPIEERVVIAGWSVLMDCLVSIETECIR